MQTPRLVPVCESLVEEEELESPITEEELQLPQAPISNDSRRLPTAKQSARACRHGLAETTDLDVGAHTTLHRSGGDARGENTPHRTIRTYVETLLRLDRAADDIAWEVKLVFDTFLVDESMDTRLDRVRGLRVAVGRT